MTVACRRDVHSQIIIQLKEIVYDTQSKVAVIGTGNIGTAVATNLVKGNCPVIIANRKIENASALSQKLGNLAQPMQMAAAIKEAEIIVFATWFDAVKELSNT